MENTHLHQICAVDGGGTGCRAAIAGADGSVLAYAAGGPANYTTNATQAVNNVVDTVRDAAAQLGSKSPIIQKLVAHVGLAGIMSDADARSVATQLPFDICNITDDRETSLIGALGDRDGALLAIGTGTFAASRHGNNMRYFGGWGFRVGDQASGARLGRELLEHTLMVCDGLEAESDLTRSTLAKFSGSSADIVAFASTANPDDYATFAPLIVNAAIASDPVGHKLMERGAAYLDTILGSADISEDDIVCLTGGVGPHYERYLRPEYRDRIHQPMGVALDGALQLARRKLHEMETPV